MVESLNYKRRIIIKKEMSNFSRRFAAVEGGGTTWVVAIAQDKPDNIIERAVFETDPNPVKTLTEIRNWLKDREFSSIGVASFGPVDAKVGSATYGFITSTPKPGWANTDVLRLLGIRDEFKHLPFKFDTDVNAPAMAEYRLHKQPGTTSCAYITVGTGIGVGLVINGNTVQGLVHPEAGHIQTAPFDGETFQGTCPFHKTCVEGMASSGAIAARKGCLPSELVDLNDDDAVWDACSYYLAQLCANLVLIASPERICIGGGLLNRSSLYGKIRSKTQQILSGYIQNDNITTDKIENYIVPSYWGSNAGIVGAAYLAMIALEEHEHRQQASST